MVAAAPTLRLATPRLVVRRTVAADVDVLTAHETDAQIMRYIRDVPPVDVARAKAQAMVAPWSGQDGEWLGLAIVPAGAERLAGIVALRVVAAVHETLELGYRLHPDWHGQGLATEACRAVVDWAFAVGRVHRIVALCVAENTASARVMAKLGMQREGRMREYARLQGRWHDELVYGLLADDPRPTR